MIASTVVESLYLDSTKGEDNHEEYDVFEIIWWRINHFTDWNNCQVYCFI